MNGMRTTGSRKIFDTCGGDVRAPKRTVAIAGTSALGREMPNSGRSRTPQLSQGITGGNPSGSGRIVLVADLRTSFLDQTAPRGPLTAE